jgi:hypothetical protein
MELLITLFIGLVFADMVTDDDDFLEYIKNIEE